MQVQGTGITYDTAALTAGTVFDTEFETGCVVTEAPDLRMPHISGPPQFNFAATDSDGVECEFSTVMVAWIHRVTI